MSENGIDDADEANQTDEKRYEKAYRETRRALDESIDLLTLLQEFETNLNAQSKIGEKLIKLERQRADLVRANLEFHSGRAVMAPPSPELVNEIVENTKLVVDLTVERATASAVLKISTKALSKFAEIQDIENS